MSPEQTDTENQTEPAAQSSSPKRITRRTSERSGRPEHHEYFLKIALAVSERAVCTGRHVGAVLVKDGRIIATGYNGTPEHMPNCDEKEKGCYRCAHRDQFDPGAGYDLCICVHAEQNALLSAARFGTAVEGSVLYSTHAPCFGCAKEALQAKVDSVYYIESWSHPTTEENVQQEYLRLVSRFPRGFRQRDVTDTTLEKPSEGEPLKDTGHTPEP